MVLFQLAPVDISQQTNRADGMFVDGIMVIHVELHLRDDTPKIRNKPAKDRGFIHPAKHRLGIARRCQNIEEKGIGTRVAPHCLSDQSRIPLCHAHC